MQTEPKIPLIVRHLMSELQPVGSRITCDPAPTDTDEDFLVAIPPWKIAAARIQLEAEGWRLNGSEVEDEHGPAKNIFYSYKRDEINLILTADRPFFDRFMLATAVAKDLNLLHKEDRVTLFQAILYGNAPKEPAEPVELDAWETFDAQMEIAG